MPETINPKRKLHTANPFTPKVSEDNKRLPDPTESVGKKPNLWSIFAVAGKGNHVCSNVFTSSLILALGQSLDFAVSSYNKLLAMKDPSEGVSILEGMTYDLAETLAYRTNLYVDSEQKGCSCKSSLSFVVKQTT